MRTPRERARGIAQGEGATAVLIGIAPAAALPDEWKGWLRHRDRERRPRNLERPATRSSATTPSWGARPLARGPHLDARKPPPNLSHRRRPGGEVDALVVLAVGSDCNVGKMTAQLQLRE